MCLCAVKLKFHGNIFLVTSSLHTHEDVHYKSCVLDLWNLENDTTHGQTDSHHYTTADRRPTNQVSAWQAERARHVNIRARKLRSWKLRFKKLLTQARHVARKQDSRQVT